MAVVKAALAVIPLTVVGKVVVAIAVLILVAAAAEKKVEK